MTGVLVSRWAVRRVVADRLPGRHSYDERTQQKSTAEGGRSAERRCIDRDLVL
jgi:hypothetical protein